MPDEFHRMVENRCDGVEGVVIAVRPGENDNAEFHEVPAPCGIAGTPILAQEHTSTSAPPGFSAPPDPRTRHRRHSPRCRRPGWICDAQCWEREGLRYRISQIEFQRHPARRWQTRVGQANNPIS